MTEKEKEFDEVVKPIMKFLAENYNPHTKIIIDSTSAELVKGERAFNTLEFIKD